MLSYLKQLSKSTKASGTSLPQVERESLTLVVKISSGAEILSTSSTSPNLPISKLFLERKEVDVLLATQ